MFPCRARKGDPTVGAEPTWKRLSNTTVEGQFEARAIWNRKSSPTVPTKRAVGCDSREAESEVKSDSSDKASPSEVTAERKSRKSNLTVPTGEPSDVTAKRKRRAPDLAAI